MVSAYNFSSAAAAPRAARAVLIGAGVCARLCGCPDHDRGHRRQCVAAPRRGQPSHVRGLVIPVNSHPSRRGVPSGKRGHSKSARQSRVAGPVGGQRPGHKYTAEGCQHIQKDVLALYRPSAQCAIQATVVGADPTETNTCCLLLAVPCPPLVGSVGPTSRAPGDDETSSPTPGAGAVSKVVAPEPRAAVSEGWRLPAETVSG